MSFRQIGLPVRESDYINPAEPFLTADDLMDNEMDAVPEDLGGQDGITDEQLDKAPVKESEDMNYLRTFFLSNEKVRMNSSFSVEPGNQKVHQSWEAIITGATLDLENLIDGDSQQKLFDEIAAKITPEMEKAVSDAEREVEKAMLDQQEKYTEYFFEGKMKAWRNIGRIYQKRVDNARARYRRVARKYEEYSAILDANGIDPSALLIKRAKTAFESWQIQLGTMASLPYTFMTPSDWYDPDALSGWTTYSESEYSKKTEINKTSKSVGGDLKLNLGLWSLGGGGGSSSEKEAIAIDTENLNISFSYCIARVNRPWMDTSILNTKNWFLRSSSNVKFEQFSISDGSFSQTYQNKPFFFLPSIITSLILIKDVKITWATSSAEKEFNKVTKEGKGAIGWGPIRLGGGVDKGSESTVSSSERADKELGVAGIQLIGYVSEILPSSPFISSK